MGTNAEYIGSGYLALRDTASNTYNCGVLQDVALEISSSVKELFGAKKSAVLVAETNKKYTLKAKFAQLSTPLVAAVMGGTTASGGKYVGTVTKTVGAGAATIATTDFSSPAGWAFVADLGVVYAATNQPFTFNSGTPAVGEYKNTAGAYTFNTSDNGTNNVIISSVYSATAGQTTTATNQDVGLSTFFSVYLFNSTTQQDGTVRKFGWNFPAVIIPKLSIASKNDEFTTQDLEMTACADASGNVAYFFNS